MIVTCEPIMLGETVHEMRCLGLNPGELSVEHDGVVIDQVPIRAGFAESAGASIDKSDGFEPVHLARPPK